MTQGVDKELPFSEEEISDKKARLDDLNVEIGTVINMDKDVWEIIGSIYNPENLLVQSLEVLGNNYYRVKFFFPEYKAISIRGDHVSATQMQGAIIQALYCSIGLSIRQDGVDAPMSYETFLLNRENALYRRDSRTFRKKLKFKEEGFLIIKLDSVVKKGNIYSIMAHFLKDKDVFLTGWVECIIQDQYLYDEGRSSLGYKNIKDSKLDESVSLHGNIGKMINKNKTTESISDIISLNKNVKND